MLSKENKKKLRAMSHGLNASLQVGKSGVTPAFLASLDEELDAHEIVKVSILKTSPIDTKSALEECLNATGAELVHKIGHTFTLYRLSEDNLLEL